MALFVHFFVVFFVTIPPLLSSANVTKSEVKNVAKKVDGIVANEMKKLRVSQSKVLATLKPTEAEKLKEVAKHNPAMSLAEQEKLLRGFSAKMGVNVTNAVEKLIKLRSEADSKLETLAKERQRNMTKEAKEADKQLMVLLMDKNAGTEQKLTKIEQLVKKLPVKTREETDTNDLKKMQVEIKQYLAIIIY
uniref:Uncharacterized protein n=1 Tax=Globodera rostochiensis TaxID=31243 RepID=A0A914HYC2_GLORO